MQEVTSSPLLAILVSIGLVYITLFAVVYLKKAYTRCIELGITKEKLAQVIRSSLIFTIVPSLSIVVGLFVLITTLGTVWSWWRLSVIGSLSYETLISQSIAATMGTAVSEMSAREFGVILILMSVGMLSGFCVLIPFGKKLCMSVSKNENASTWTYVLSGCFMLCLFSVYIPVLLFGDFVQAAVMITGLIVALLLSFLATRPGLGWLGNFIMAVSMIAGMASSLFWVNIFG